MAQDRSLQVAIRKPDFSKSMFVDFDVEREEWNRYRLDDKTILRSKIVFSGFMVDQNINELAAKAQPDKKVILGFGFRSMNVFGVEAPSDLRGIPDTKKYASDELKASVVEKVGFETVRETWNSYLLANGMQVKAKISPTFIGRTNKFDEAGFPVYWVELGVELIVDLPRSIQEALAEKPLKKKLGAKHRVK